MDQKLINFNKSQQKAKIPTLNVGDVVRVHRSVKEGNKERIQIFEGLIIAVKGKQSSSPTITVRKISKNTGIEMIFPIFSPVITKIEIVRHSNVRRAKLYYMRDRFGKAAKMKIMEIDKDELAEKSTEKENKKKKETEDKNTSKKEVAREAKDKKENSETVEKEDKEDEKK